MFGGEFYFGGLSKPNPPEPNNPVNIAYWMHPDQFATGVDQNTSGSNGVDLEPIRALKRGTPAAAIQVAMVFLVILSNQPNIR